MKKRNLENVLFTMVQVMVITGITLFALSPFSCKISEEGIKVIGGDYVPPVLDSFTVINESTLQLCFSEKVNLTQGIVSKVSDKAYDSLEHSETEDLSAALAAANGAEGSISSSFEYSEDGKTVTIALEKETEIGESYEFYGCVKDLTGNTLTFAVPFTGFNSRIPKIVMTEIQTVSVSSQSTKEKEAGIYKNEFIEFLALTDGNLCGLEVCSGYDGESKKYEFPKIEVKKGEVFTVHMRNRGNGCISEEEEDLTQAFSSYTSDSVRDLWTDITETTLGNKTDVIIVRNQANGSIVDAVMYRDSAVTEWSKSMGDYAALVYESEIYASAAIEGACDVSDKTDSKTIQRSAAAELRENALKDEEIDYPVKVDSTAWAVGTVSAGEL